MARLGTVAIGVLLARILGPHQFGTYAVAYVALIVVLSFNELGVSLAIVRWPSDPAEIAPTVTTISVLASILIYAGCYAAAPAFTTAMGAPAATSVVRVLALNVVVDGLVASPAALIQRNFLQDKKTIADQVNVWVGAFVTIGLALSGFGAMSLAVGRLAGCVIGGIPLLVFSPEPLRFGFNPVKARHLFRFGLPLAGSSLIVLAAANIDQIVVGHTLGATALGFYVLAFNLSSWPGTIFSLPVRAIAPAAFSRLQHDRKAMGNGFLNVAGLLCAVALPICVLMSQAASPLIGFVYGPHWMPAARALLWLALLAGLRIFFELVYDYFVVLAKSRVVLTVQLAWLLALIPALILGARMDGISGVALAGVAVAAGIVLPWYVLHLRETGIPALALGRRVVLPLIGSVVTALAVMAIVAVAPTFLTALIAGGTVTLLIIGLLIYLMRASLGALRAPVSEPEPEGAALPAHGKNATRMPDHRPPGHAPDPPDTSHSPDHRPPVQAPGVAARRAAAQTGGALEAPADVTVPLPVYQDITAPLRIVNYG